jgi:hypothetical protein
MSTDEPTTPDELEQRQPVRPEEDEFGEGTTTPDPMAGPRLDTEADEADVFEQSQSVPDEDEEDRS